MSRSISDRTVSTANSGMPCAWLVIARRAAAGIPGTSASTSSSIDAASSGSRVSVLRLRPAPNPGRAWLQLGPGEHQHEDRQVPRPVDQVVEEVQQPASAYWASSISSTTGCVRGQPLEEQPPPREQLLPRQRGRRRPPSKATPSSRPSRAPTYARSPGSGTNRSRPAASLAAATVGGVLLGDAQPLPDDLRQRPERHAVAVGQAAAAVPPHRRRPARRRTSRTPSPAATCRPRPARTPATSRGTRRSAAAWKSSLTVRSSASRPVSGASRPSTRCDAAHRRTAPGSARHSCIGSALPFSVMLAGVGEPDRRRRPAGWVGLVDQHLTRARPPPAPARRCSPRPRPPSPRRSRPA